MLAVPQRRNAARHTGQRPAHYLCKALESCGIGCLPGDVEIASEID